MPKNAHDLEWLDLALTGDGRRASMHVQDRHLSPVGRLYGGTAVAAAVALMEEATEGTAAWVTVQYASSCGLDEVLDLRVGVSAAGRRTSQLEVTATLGEREIFVALGAVRAAPDPADGAAATPEEGPRSTAQWQRPPDVPPPEACTPLVLPAPFSNGNMRMTELRPVRDGGGGRDGHAALWCRPDLGGPLSAAVLGWQADMVGFAIAPAMAAMGSTSLDNTVRFGPPADPAEDWVLADIRGQLATGGVGHGTVDLWSRDGTLLAVASQSCLLRAGPGPG